MLLSFVIPCLNEEQTILRVIAAAQTAARKNAIRSYEIVVADNGSTDSSIPLIRKQHIARIVHVPIRGYGAALHWGISRARGEYVIFADADMSYDFGELKKFIPYFKPSKKRTQVYDLVLGSRLLGKILPGAMPPIHRYVGTPVLSFLIRVMYALPTTDSNSGMRLVRKAFYDKLKMRNSGMEWASELLIKTALYQGVYAEVPITLRPDQRDRAPHLLRWIDGWRHLKAIVLLQPNVLLLFFLGCLVISAAFVQSAPTLSFFSSLTAFGVILAILAAKLLQYAIDGRESMVAQLIEKVPLVFVVFCFSIFGCLSIILFPKNFLYLKLFLASLVVLLNIWFFFIETIKTHLMRRLPDKL